MRKLFMRHLIQRQTSAPQNLPASGAQYLVSANTAEIMEEGGQRNDQTQDNNEGNAQTNEQGPANDEQSAPRDGQHPTTDQVPLLHNLSFQYNESRQCLIVSFITIVGAVVLAGLIAILVLKNTSVWGKGMNTGGLYKFISHEEWSGAPIPGENLTRLELPANTVIFYQTNTPICKNETSCAKRMLQIQTKHMEKFHQPDIGYNFLVAGNKLIYEGRGWNYRPYVPYGQNDNTIAIAFIGNFDGSPASFVQIEVAKKFLVHAMYDHRIVKCPTMESDTVSRPLVNIVESIDSFIRRLFFCPKYEEATH